MTRQRLLGKTFLSESRIHTDYTDYADLEKAWPQALSRIPECQASLLVQRQSRARRACPEAFRGERGRGGSFFTVLLGICNPEPGTMRSCNPA